tara:strand:- start:7256 stop:7753 length:498 start_codon:yes stop_codon:yes gene_type:complete
MFLQEICSPALIYLVFSITHVVIDTVQGMYSVAFIKLWVALIFTILLNFLCSSGLGIISWFIVFIPFILMTVIVSFLLLMFGLDPLTGRRPRVIRSNGDIKRRHKRRTRLGYLHSGSLIRDKRPKHIHHNLNDGYDESEISDSQKHVLDDVVKRRTTLHKDPLHK